MSVPWSRLKPRRKYWLALPPPACCVMIRPGSVSRISPERRIGRFLSSPAPTVTWAGGTGNPDKVIRPVLHVDAGAHCAHGQGNTQRSRRSCGSYGDKDFFVSKPGFITTSR